MDKNKYFNLKNKVIFFLSFCILLILVLVSVLPNSFASLVPVKSISFESEKLSYEKNEAGSYKITKSAEWIAKGKARITFQVDTKELKKENTKADTILIVDTSGSMAGEKLDKVKSDSVDLINKISENKENRISIIEFNTNATLLSDFTNNTVELTEKINNLQATGGTNYYQALVKLDEILKNYQKEKEREVLTLFLTDGYPGIDTPNEVGQYKYLKSEYPYININAVQYEMGSTVLEAIKNISDKQFIADMDTLNNVLIDAAVPRQIYNNFKITDYINTEYFTIEDIKTSIGKASLDNEKVIWNLDKLSSGKSVTMTIDVYLKEEYIDKFDLYKTNTKEEVTSEINGIKENISKTDTPILSNSFTVSYDENTPEGCSVEGTVPESKQYSVFNPVKIEDTTPTCEGYEFQGWEVANKDNVSMIGNSYFISDGNDIKLRAIWSKVSIKKSMNGTVQKVEPVIQAVPYDEENKGEFWNSKYKGNITKIMIQNELNPIEGAMEFWDVSEAKDGSVMAYAVLNEDTTTYTIYLQGPGKIIANENSSNLFSKFYKLKSIEGLEYLDTSQATNMKWMFGWNDVESLDLSKFDTSQVTDMSYMFYNCTNLKELDLNGLETSNVRNMKSMFENCGSLITLDLSSFDTSKVTNMNNMFNLCDSLKELDLSNFNTQNVTDMSGMFNYCEILVSLDLSNFDTSNVTDMSYMFNNCISLASLNLSNFDTSKVTNMSVMFSSCSSLTELDVSSFDTSKVTNMGSQFQHCKSLTELDLSNFDTANVTNMNYMFSSCSNLIHLDLSNFNTSNVTNMSFMFIHCSSLSRLDLSSFNTSRVTNITSMFYGCSSLKLIDFRNGEFTTIKYSNNTFKDTSDLSIIVKDESARSWIQDKLGSNGTAIIAS